MKPTTVKCGFCGDVRPFGGLFLRSSDETLNLCEECWQMVMMTGPPTPPLRVVTEKASHIRLVGPDE